MSTTKDNNTLKGEVDVLDYKFAVILENIKLNANPKKLHNIKLQIIKELLHLQFHKLPKSLN